MDLILRTFKVNEGQWLRLTNRASLEHISSADLVRQFVDAFLTTVTVLAPSTETNLVLRGVYLTREQDAGLETLAQKLQTTKGAVFRAALAVGLGV